MRKIFKAGKEKVDKKTKTRKKESEVKENRGNEEMQKYGWRARNPPMIEKKKRKKNNKKKWKKIEAEEGKMNNGKRERVSE